MKILLIEPFYTGSHKQWVDGWKHHSQHDITLLTLPGRHWKWRMHGAAITLAKKYQELETQFDVVIVSDILDLSVFIALARLHKEKTKIGVYFHENQLTYPWSPYDEDVKLQRDRHYAFINYTSCLAADFIWFNSNYHRNAFLGELPTFLKAFPDHQNLNSIDEIADKSSVMHLGMDLSHLLNAKRRHSGNHPILLWNHRWEYDKNVDEFYELCLALKNGGVVFELIVCGEKYSRYPETFDTLQSDFSQEIIHFGWAESKTQYHDLLRQAHLLVVTSKQDFFGGSAVEAMAAGCRPFLPNRLAFPEHVPDSLKTRVLFNQINEVVNAISSESWELSLSEKMDLANHIGRYDWSRMATQYDNAIQNV